MLDHLISEEIVPDVIPSVPSSPEPLTIKFGDGSEVKFGNQLEIKNILQKPSSVSWDGKEGSFYTLCLTDPDAPTRAAPTMKERAHWLVVNIPGSRWQSGEVLMEYVPSCPPKGSGLHRYTFVVYEQKGKMDASGKVKVDASKEMWDHRKQFSLRNWAKPYCEERPVAANFYVAEWDEDAQKIRDSLGV